jgi:hypothetical protein
LRAKPGEQRNVDNGNPEMPFDFMNMSNVIGLFGMAAVGRVRTCQYTEAAKQ